MNRRIRTTGLLSALLCAACAFPAHAQVSVTDPWVRATVAQQQVTGAFMRITSIQDARLIDIKSPLAGVVELHQMAMENDVMKMRAVKALDLPAGKSVELKPGGYHLMLMDLKRPLKEGETVPLTLVVEGRDKKRSNIEVKAQVKPLAASGAMEHEHKH